MLVSSQYKRFIELITERNVKNAFKEKYAALVCTSIHFYDHTAINYINAICDDLEMKFVDFFSADMGDLMIENMREQLFLFAENFIYIIDNNLPTSKKYPPLNYRKFNYEPSEFKKDNKKIDAGDKKVRIITDSTDEKTNLGKMIKKFLNCFSSEVEVINLNDIDIKGGCLGCIRCGYDNQCVYKGKDDLMEFWNTKLITSDILIFAGNIKDRYLSSRWKMVFDRGFFNGHVPTLIGKQMGFIISGPLGQISNLRQILQARIEFQESNFVDIITDEFGESFEIDSLLHNFANQLIKFSSSNYIKPPTFLAEGGKRILRDAVYGKLRFVFRADDKYYEKTGLYDTFPQNDKNAKKMNDMLIPLIENNEDFRKNFYANTNKAMLKQFKNILAKADK